MARLMKKENIQQEFLFRNSTVALMRDAPEQFQKDLVAVMLSGEPHPAAPSAIETCFGPLRLPGTSSIGLRKEQPEIFQDTLKDRKETYGGWLKRVLFQMMDPIFKDQTLSLPDPKPDPFEIFEKVKTILEFRSDRGGRFCDHVSQQSYEDVFMQILLPVLFNTFDYDRPHPYERFNAICRKIALAVLEMLTDRGLFAGTGHDHMAQLCHIAVLSGYVGINLKTTASAASALLNRDLIPVDKKWVASHKAFGAVPVADIREIAGRLIRLSAGYGFRYGIDCTGAYENEVKNTTIPTLLIFFTDDFLETILDVKRMELMLNGNPNLNVLVVPRNGRFGNDFAFEDVDHLLAEPLFGALYPLLEQGRMAFCPHGPVGGCVDPRFLSQGLMDEIQMMSKGRKMVLETKGCRNFEMLKGRIPMPWYAAFNCNRALSIRTVGIDIDPVFIRIPPGLEAYDGFTRPVIGDTPSGQTRNVRFAQMTTADLMAALETGYYRDLLAHFRHENRLNNWLMRLCKESCRTLYQVLATGLPNTNG